LKKLYFKRAYASFIKQQFKAAYSDASRAVELGIKDENTYTICAYSALELELDQEALSYLDKLIRIKPYFLENYHKRGHLRDELGDLEGAIADHDFIIKKNPNKTQYYYCRARLHQKNQESEKVLRDYTTVIEQQPEDFTGYFFRSQFYEGEGGVEQALQDMKRAYALKPDNAKVYYGLAQLLSKNNQIKEALEILKKTEPQALEAEALQLLVRLHCEKFESSPEKQSPEAKERLLQLQKLLTPEDPLIQRISTILEAKAPEKPQKTSD
jgi:tetratricopeptide (TPR) repeat protein